jgi:signal recognition particle subunit SRP72
MTEEEGSYYEVLANYNAVKASMLTAKGALENQHAIEENVETYELAYNSACGQIALGNLSKAQSLLESAKSMYKDLPTMTIKYSLYSPLFATEICRDSMVRDEYTEADIEQELAVIVAQSAYVHQLQGRTDVAIGLYQSSGCCCCKQ